NLARADLPCPIREASGIIPRGLPDVAMRLDVGLDHSCQLAQQRLAWKAGYFAIVGGQHLLQIGQLTHHPLAYRREWNLDLFEEPGDQCVNLADGKRIRLPRPRMTAARRHQARSDVRGHSSFAITFLKWPRLYSREQGAAQDRSPEVSHAHGMPG